MQKARLAMLILRLLRPNFFLLDHPTNHLDIEGQEALEDALCAKGAATLLVSQDHSLIRAVGMWFWWIEKRKLAEVDSPEPFHRRDAISRGHRPKALQTGPATRSCDDLRQPALTRHPGRRSLSPPPQCGREVRIFNRAIRTFDRIVGRLMASIQFGLHRRRHDNHQHPCTDPAPVWPLVV